MEGIVLLHVRKNKTPRISRINTDFYIYVFIREISEIRGVFVL
jgi:hypothetical protein